MLSQGRKDGDRTGDPALRRKSGRTHRPRLSRSVSQSISRISRRYSDVRPYARLCTKPVIWTALRPLTKNSARGEWSEVEKSRR